MRKIFMLMTILLVSTITASAQNFRLGVHAAANIANNEYDDIAGISDLSTESFLGYRFGLITEVGFSRRVRLMTSLLLSQKGSTLTLGGADTELKISYFEVPINLDISFGLGDIARAHIMAGPYFGIGVSGIYTLSTSNGDSQDVSFGSSTDDDFKTLDYGLSFGVGFEIRPLLVSAHYSLGMSDINNNFEFNTNITTEQITDTAIKNGVFSIGISYFFLDTDR